MTPSPSLANRIAEYAALTDDISAQIARGEHLALPNGWQVGIHPSPDTYIPVRDMAHGFRWGVVLVAPPGHENHHHDAGHVWNYATLLEQQGFAELASEASLAACQRDTPEAYGEFVNTMDQFSDMMADIQAGTTQSAGTIRLVLRFAHERFAGLVTMSDSLHTERTGDPREELFLDLLGAVGLDQQQIGHFYTPTPASPGAST